MYAFAFFAGVLDLWHLICTFNKMHALYDVVLLMFVALGTRAQRGWGVAAAAVRVCLDWIETNL